MNQGAKRSRQSSMLDFFQAKQKAKMENDVVLDMTSCDEDINEVPESPMKGSSENEKLDHASQPQLVQNDRVSPPSSPSLLSTKKPQSKPNSYQQQSSSDCSNTKATPKSGPSKERNNFAEKISNSSSRNPFCVSATSHTKLQTTVDHPLLTSPYFRFNEQKSTVETAASGVAPKTFYGLTPADNNSVLDTKQVVAANSSRNDNAGNENDSEHGVDCAVSMKDGVTLSPRQQWPVRRKNRPKLPVFEDEGVDGGSIPETFPRVPATMHLELSTLESTATHTVFVKGPWQEGRSCSPVPEQFTDVWDGDHVRMPCSASSIYPVLQEDGSKALKRRWKMIEDALLRPIRTIHDLQNAIVSYNTQHADRWNFDGLHSFFEQEVEPEEVDYFLSDILPKMIRLALCLPKLVTKPIPLLRAGASRAVTLSQHQVACLMANAFFCTFPRRNNLKRNSEFSSFPEINFNRLFEPCEGNRGQSQVAKLKCLLNYFRRVTGSSPPCGNITFERQTVSQEPYWNKSEEHFQPAFSKTNGFIETDGVGFLQVDFANMFVGGGVLRTGCVQEEIRFVVCPELIISRLFTERLDDNEVLFIHGAEQYNDCEGYADSFRWKSDFVDNTQRDMWGRRYTSIVAMDALRFEQPLTQYQPRKLRREIFKAYCGFRVPALYPAASAIATGNWGCGAFRGNARLKFLLQWIAASMTRRSLVYFTFGDSRLCAEISAIVDLITGRRLTVGCVYALLEDYYTNEVINAKRQGSLYPLYDYIYSRCRLDTDDSTSSSPSPL